jgi:hypothetical protein
MIILKLCSHISTVIYFRKCAFENERKRTKTGSEQIFVQFLLTTVTG